MDTGDTMRKLAFEFKAFLREYKIVGLAIAFVMGAATKDLVQSLVNSFIMPLITPWIPKGGWEAAVFAIGSVELKWGTFLASLINFTILALVVFIIAKKLLKEEKVKKK